MFCKYCGQEIADDSVFCAICGRNVHDSTITIKKCIETKGTSNQEPAISVNAVEKATTWYYMDGTETDGPVSADMIRKKLLNGMIGYTVKVRQRLSDPWISLADSPFADIAKNITSDPISISDKWLWCLAIIPMSAMMLLYYFKIMPIESPLSWIVPFAINALFIYLDRKELLDKGLYPEGWMWMGLILIPVYIVVREVKTNRNFVPVIIWCFLFAVETFIL